MKEKPIISIIIPSRNRQKYAINCIQSILNIKDTRIEVVVHDNSDTNELETYIEKNIDDERLVYRYDSSPMSTVHNFNKSMEFANGDYICFIGDDDGINPEIIEAAYWAKENDLDAIIAKPRISYLWPNKNRVGKQFIYPFNGKLKYVDTKKVLKKFLGDGGIFYLNYNLPKVYHGLVKRESFDKVKDKIGYYFGGLSADIFASIAVSLVATKVVTIDYPLTIAGSSSASEQTHRTEEAKNLDLKDAPHFRARGPYIWSEKIPKVYSGTTIWAESCIQAVEAFNRLDLVKLIDKYKLSAQIAIISPQHEKTILKEYLNKNDTLSINFKYSIIKIRFRTTLLLKKIINKSIRTITGKNILVHYKVDTIVDATQVFHNYRLKNNINIKKYLKY
jgi:glycosyltransferase involved in cell wall biosynthesis